MRSKALFVIAIWVAVALAVVVLYLQREASPMREFVAWALSMWPILSAIVAGAVFLSVWVLKHNFGPHKEARREQLIPTAPAFALELREPPVLLRIGDKFILESKVNCHVPKPPMQIDEMHLKWEQRDIEKPIEPVLPAKIEVETQSFKFRHEIPLYDAAEGRLNLDKDKGHLLALVGGKKYCSEEFVIPMVRNVNGEPNP